MKPTTSFEAKILAAFVASLLVVTALASITWQMARGAALAAQQVRLTQEVLNALARIRVDTALIELNTQAFRVTGEPARLKDRDDAIASREGLLQALQTQIADHPGQQARWLSLRSLVDERLAIARQIEQLRRTQGAAAANAYVASAPLVQTRAQMQQVLNQMEVAASRRLDSHSATQLEAGQRMVAAGAAVSLALLALLTGSYALIRRQLRQTEAGRQALAANEARLAITLDAIGDAVLSVDAQGRITHLNPVAERLTGWPGAEAAGQDIGVLLTLLHEVSRQPAACPVGEILSGGVLHAGVEQAVLIARDGREVPVACNATAMRDAAGALAGAVLVVHDETEARQAERTIRDQNALLEQRVAERTRQLRDNEQQLARVLEGADQGYWDWDLRTGQFRVSARWETMLGYEPGEMRVDPDSWPSFVHPDDLPDALASIERHHAGLTPKHEAEIRCRAKQGDWRWILTRGAVVARADDGAPLQMSGTHTDITERKQAELSQRESAVVFDSSYEGIMVTNAEGLMSKVNPAFTRITGYSAEEALGRSPRMLASGRHDAAFFTAFRASLNTHGFWHGEIWNRRKSGDLYATLQSVSAVHDVHGRVLHYISVFSDISQLKAHEAELDRVAHFDSLTGLPNRRLLLDRLQQSVLRSQRSGRLSAVCFIDLDGFKAINDALGHAVGDRLLVGVSEHLTAVLRAEDTLARLGGDEFVLLLSEVGSFKEAVLILDRVLDAVRQPVNAEGHLLNITASIGVSLFPDDDADPDTLLRHADQTMYLAKQCGKNRYQLFDPEVDRIAQTRREQLARLRVALQRGELVLHYQPKVDLGNGEVIGAEALIRWQHPERGLLPPAEFLPLLNGSDFEPTVGEWVIDTALDQIEAWARQGLALPVSVNVSAKHLLLPDFSERLGLTLARHPAVPAGNLELEVLETTAIEDMQQAAEILHRCRALGVRFALDDFGTGYSSLTYLRQLPVHTLKIDRSFVRDMLVDPEDLGIVRGVIELAGAFNREVIAEGVETLAHGQALLAMGCRRAQGYGVARPMPAQDLPAWRAAWLHAEAWRSA